TNLLAGDYFVTVFDGNLCSSNAGPISITQPTALTAVLTGSTPATCFGDNDGTAGMTPGGGVGGYTFSWEGQVSGLISTAMNPVNLVADTYDLTLSDGNGCSKTFTDFAIITEPDVLDASVVTTIDVSCAGGSDGSADITPLGGTTPYTFAWTGTTSGYTFAGEDPVNMPADVFDLTLTDVNNCTMDFPGIVTISEPAPIAVTVDGTSVVSCFGGTDGGANITVSGGTPSYTIAWTGTGTGHTSSGASPNDLITDTYDVSITDAMGCVEVFNSLVTITEPNDITVTIDNVVLVECNGAATGAIDITPAEGTPGGAGTGYTYAWTGPNGFTSSAEDITNLLAGDYFVTVFDGNLCSSNAGPISITQPTELTAVLTGSTPATCFGDNDGTAGMTPGGGVGGYTFSWEGQVSGLISTAMNPVNLVADTYDLTLSDGNGCSKTFTD
ncbi:MAG: hypothetical protein GY732_21385, partial [Gammaproteobacteria bacterium]|nr:hypothetical protein [Gammaproteobacteria bacterium]